MNPLDIRDIAIIDAFPIYSCRKTVLNVGCGEGRLDWYLARMGYRVYATDIDQHPRRPTLRNLTFHKSGIFDLSSFPIASSPIVICSQVLEHLKEYRVALAHLLALTEGRLIITVPYRRSFPHPDHINFWDDEGSSTFKDIHDFIAFCDPYSTAISKIRTKPEDVKMGRWNYLIVIDKRQNLVEAIS